uniref:Uncharacterized protein n=1 Tax=Romanomermis culicivorax TaxID=13658 RepID=A0A915JPT3_ROMCU
MNFFHVIGGQHAPLARALYGARHPTLVDRLAIYNHVAFFKTDLLKIDIVGRIIVHGPVGSASRFGAGAGALFRAAQGAHRTIGRRLGAGMTRSAKKFRKIGEKLKFYPNLKKIH